MKRTDKNSILMTDEAGVIYDCDNNYKLKHSFKTGWDVEVVTKLKNGEFVVGAHQGKKVFLIHFSADGKVIENE